MVSNHAGTQTSDTIELKLIHLGYFDADLIYVSDRRRVGGMVVSATGTLPLKYQWSKGGC